MFLDVHSSKDGPIDIDPSCHHVFLIVSINWTSNLGVETSAEMVVLGCSECSGFAS